MSEFLSWAIYFFLVIIAYELWRIGDKIDKIDKK